MKKEIINLVDIWKVYRLGPVDVPVLKGINLSIETGEHLSIMGPSGSGKTTILNILGCLDKPTEGQYLMEERKISTLSDDELSEIRSRKVGFVFQTFNLIPQLTVLENIGIPLFYQGVDEITIKEKAFKLADIVGLGERIKHRPSELSGGERQRVAIARALINQPILILADEPTGNLDSETGKEIMDLLIQLNKEGKTLVVITHDPKIAGYSQKVVRLFDGEIVDEN
ncbi:MAG: ABC transporter ATP-binding protein [Candidatus Omnitrophica bacterium]|nr:ABC transporter ATP-binding protein [Candidatus Omnitrophota bacterium]MBU1047757.1 ABC transporter ATP-binding protein [Candidatus Omnitrophota bacterium]MBU1631074.1 ABC transporter ATP-binding protein [Candidatus Omnitrophota bacterium]MBU1766965.1 ABC transporter ATP-binding protein [Candidatus Omnitrophota bacterium]MBU1889342.1 ABC transporter ATP-binding protein [Candidatus Omnitrophota bacterium]